jgi:PilZ domain-containing protein
LWVGLAWTLPETNVEMLLGKETTMLQPTQERRVMRRFDMRLPASVKVDGVALDEFLTETQNVSARGVFFYLDRTVAEGSHIEVTLTFPPHVTLTDSVRVRFRARVIRVEAPLPASRIGVAALIEEYEFLRSAPASELLDKMQ